MSTTVYSGFGLHLGFLKRLYTKRTMLWNPPDFTLLNDQKQICMINSPFLYRIFSILWNILQHRKMPCMLRAFKVSLLLHNKNKTKLPNKMAINAVQKRVCIEAITVSEGHKLRMCFWCMLGRFRIELTQTFTKQVTGKLRTERTLAFFIIFLT